MLRIIIAAVIFFFVSRWLARLFPTRPGGSPRNATPPHDAGPRGAAGGTGGRSEGWRATRAVDADFEDISGTK
jgi:hypothetical protein